MKLFFIYDVSNSDPDDDPRDSIIYSYPPHKELDSDTCLLYCQIIGVARFMKNTFNDLSMITLDGNCFVSCQTENYLLILGGSENESNECLKTQMLLINKVFAFYHISLRHLFSEVNENQDMFKKKLSKVWTLYLSILQRRRDILKLSAHSLPVIVFPETCDVTPVNLLNVTQAEFGVLAGAVFCHKLLFYTQFLPNMTNSVSFLITHNQSAEDVCVDFKLPLGVKLKRVYLTEFEAKHFQKHRCHRFLKKRIKPFRPSNTGSEADIDSDCHVNTFLHPMKLFETSKHSIYSDMKGIYRTFPVNLPCPKHQKWSISNQKGSCDFEFQCFQCTKETKCLILSRSYFMSRFKRFNSETDIVSINKQEKLKLKILPVSKQKTRRRRRSSLFKNSSSSNQEKETTKSNCKWTDVFYSPFYKTSQSVENYHLHESLVLGDKVCHSHVLYVQKYGHCSLALLLQNVPSLYLVLNLWYYGLSTLPRIAYNTRSKPTLQKDGNFSIYTFKYKSKLLRGNILSPIDPIKSAIHEDFYNDPLLHAVSVVESKRSICAYNTKDKQIFYEQPGVLHHKSDWFSQFWERACRRTERYLNILLPKM